MSLIRFAQRVEDIAAIIAKLRFEPPEPLPYGIRKVAVLVRGQPGEQLSVLADSNPPLDQRKDVGVDGDNPVPRVRLGFRYVQGPGFQVDIHDRQRANLFDTCPRSRGRIGIST